MHLGQRYENPQNRAAITKNDEEYTSAKLPSLVKRVGRKGTKISASLRTEEVGLHSGENKMKG